MDNKIKEFMQELEKAQEKIFEFKFYELGNIKKFIQELKEIKLEITSDNFKDEKYKNFIGKEIERLEVIAVLLKSKKLEKQREDFKPLGKYIQELGKEIEDYEI